MLRITAFGLIMLTFLGSVGVLIYSHTCLHEQITINTLFTTSDHCEQDHKEQVTDSCCDDANVDKAVKNDHCCSESVSAFYLSFQFSEQLPAFQFIVPDFTFDPKVQTNFVSKQGRAILALASDPDPPSGREILTRSCVWRL